MKSNFHSMAIMCLVGGLLIACFQIAHAMWALSLENEDLKEEVSYWSSLAVDAQAENVNSVNAMVNEVTFENSLLTIAWRLAAKNRDNCWEEVKSLRSKMEYQDMIFCSYYEGPFKECLRTLWAK